MTLTSVMSLPTVMRLKQAHVITGSSMTYGNTEEEHDERHRWYDARCKYCGARFAGKPLGLRKHTVKCKKAELGAQVDALKGQQKAGNADSDDSKGM